MANVPDNLKEVNSQVTVSTKLMTNSDMVLFMKGKNHPHFVALFVQHLIDEETSFNSDVCSRAKENHNTVV